MSLDRKILDRIEKESLSIRPKWFFTVKNMVFGTGTLIATILGSISLALFFEVMALQGKNLTWLSVPYILAVAMAAFLILGYWIAKRVDYLYKLKFASALSVLFFLSLTFGYLAYASGEARRIERKIKRIPIYAKVMPVEKELPTYRAEKSERWRNKEWQRREDGESENKTGDSYHRHHHSENYERDRDDRGEDRPDSRSEKDCDVDPDKISEEKQDEDDEKDEPVKGEVRGVAKEAVKEAVEAETDDEKGAEDAAADDADDADEDADGDEVEQKDDEPEGSESDAADED